MRNLILNLFKKEYHPLNWWTSVKQEWNRKVPLSKRITGLLDKKEGALLQMKGVYIVWLFAVTILTVMVLPAEALWAVFWTLVILIFLLIVIVFIRSYVE